jgi:hypothetical protein
VAMIQGEKCGVGSPQDKHMQSSHLHKTTMEDLSSFGISLHAKLFCNSNTDLNAQICCCPIDNSIGSDLLWKKSSNILEKVQLARD